MKSKWIMNLHFKIKCWTVLPEEIGWLSNIRCFDLSQTEITELPSSICSLTNLQALLLSKFHRLIALPEEIGRLSNIRCFDLSQTEITELPSSTCSLTNLQTLLLSKCHRLTALPEEIGRLSNLRLLMWVKRACSLRWYDIEICLVAFTVKMSAYISWDLRVCVHIKFVSWALAKKNLWVEIDSLCSL